MNMSHAPNLLRSAALVAMSASMLITGSACDQQTTDTTNIVQNSGNADRLDWTATATLGASSSCEHALEQLKENTRTEMLMQVEQVRRQLLDPDGFGNRFISVGAMDDVGMAESAASSDGGAAGGHIRRGRLSRNGRTSGREAERRGVR